ncbi:MAG: tRNA uridine-5-carboxymethylaminomethyl(34) synthesis GTPase MnmE [Bacilli bacterium]|nr:tRNA uridine-5-carboxymethylaminomethyl(34) synthesis GTPase MnmE [Bacilli bacterium]
MNDTICAICTSLGTGAISIIRVSGEESLSIVSKIFSKDLTKLADHTINYGFIKYESEIIDEVLVAIMKGPKSYTCEDVVEINCHGGIATTNKILEILLAEGCRLATPGEFTKRAYLNGRLNLSQAQAVNDLLTAKSDAARKVFINGLQGVLTKKIREIRQVLVDLISNIEVNIDFPEYEDNLVITNEILEKHLNSLKEDFTSLLEDAKTTNLVKEGINVCLVGKPNSGKSSLLNALLNEEKAIVSNIEGTTRDIVEGTINLNGISLNLIDTAGIRETENEIEKIGVEKSKKAIDMADLIIIVIDKSKGITSEDQELIDNVPEEKRIIFMNKDDLEGASIPSDYKVITGNTQNIEGIRGLKQEIINMFNLDQINSKDVTYLNNINQINVIKKCLDLTLNALTNLKNNAFVDMIEIDIRTIWELLGELIGEQYDEELLDNLFKNFCLGK